MKNFFLKKKFARKGKRTGTLKQLLVQTVIAQKSGIVYNLIGLYCGFISSLDLELQFYYCPQKADF